MIIGIDASRANRDYKTGTEWYAYYLIKNLLRIDNNNRYFLYTDSPLKRGILRDATATVTEKFLKWPMKSFWTLGRFSLEMLKRKLDVLFVPAHSLPLFHPKNTITTIHDIGFVHNEWLFDKDDVKETVYFRKLVNLLIAIFSFGRYRLHSVDYLKWSTRFALRHARRIITVSNFTKKEIVRIYGTPAEKIKVIYNGYNNSLYKKIDHKENINEVLDKYEIKDGYILYVGRLEKKKNVANLVEAFALLRENHPEIKNKLVLIGSAGFGYDEIKYTIEEYNLWSEVIMLGWVDEKDMPYLFNAASAFVFPTHYEGFGIPVIQALACGVPTAVSDIEVLREVAADSVLYFDKDNRRDMSEKMYQLLVDSKLRSELKERGYKRAKMFSWKKCAEETLLEIEAMVKK